MIITIYHDVLVGNHRTRGDNIVPERTLELPEDTSGQLNDIHIYIYTYV